MAGSSAPSKIGRDGLEAQLRRRPAQVRLQDLAHVHTAGHAQRVQQDLHRGAVGQEGHVLLGQDLGDHALVAVPAGHLVAHRNHPLRRQVDLDHLQHAAAELVAALHRVQPPVAGVDGRLDRRPAGLVDLLHLGLALRAADVQRVEVELLGLLGHVAVLLALDQRVAVLVGELLLRAPPRSASTSAPKAAAIRSLPSASASFKRVLEGLPLVLGEAHAAGELLRVDDDPLHARGHFQRIVLHVFAGAAEDGVQQLLFRRQLGLRLGRDLAHQDVARLDVGAHADDAALVQVAEHLFADVGDVAGEFLAAQLGLADFDVEFLDVDRGVGVVLHQFFADDDGVLEVESVPGHEGPQHVAAQGQLALVGGGAVGDDLALLHLVAQVTIGFWFWQVRSLRPTNFRRGYTSPPISIRRAST